MYSLYRLGGIAVMALGLASPSFAAGLFPETLVENTTGEPASTFTGAPDDAFYGLGGQVVTYDFELARIIDDSGADFNVYEVDWGNAEFGSVDVLVSLDGETFVSLKTTESAALILDGDEAHGDINFARSYDLSGSGLSEVRYVRLDGTGTGAAGSTSGFDLDAIGAANYRLIPEPSSAILLVGGLLALRRR